MYEIVTKIIAIVKRKVFMYNNCFIAFPVVVCEGLKRSTVQWGDCNGKAVV
mgnify:CR=1 FL=1